MGHDAFDAAARDGSALSWNDALTEAVAICDREIDEPGEDRPPRSRIQVPGIDRDEDAWLQRC
jgi:hypothetical protein